MITREYVEKPSSPVNNFTSRRFDFVAVYCYSNIYIRSNAEILENIYDVHKGEYIFKKWIQKVKHVFYFVWLGDTTHSNVLGVSGSWLEKSRKSEIYLINYYAPQIRSYLLENII